MGVNFGAVVASREQYSTSTFDYDMYISTFSRVGSTIKCAEAHQNLDFATTQDNNPQIAARHTSLGSTTTVRNERPRIAA